MPNQPTIEQLAAASDLVVVGKVLRNEARWVGKRIVTTSEVQPLESLKGGATEPVRVSFLGGTVGVINQHVTHEATLVEGEVAVLFLKQPAPQVAERMEGLTIVHERGKLPLLLPGEPESRLKDNRRLRRSLDTLTRRVQRGGK